MHYNALTSLQFFLHRNFSLSFIWFSDSTQLIKSTNIYDIKTFVRKKQRSNCTSTSSKCVSVFVVSFCWKINICIFDDCWSFCALIACMIKKHEWIGALKIGTREKNYLCRQFESHWEFDYVLSKNDSHHSDTQQKTNRHTLHTTNCTRIPKMKWNWTWRFHLYPVCIMNGVYQRIGSTHWLWHDRYVAEHQLTLIMC